jgi:hypothetical protein
LSSASSWLVGLPVTWWGGFWFPFVGHFVNSGTKIYECPKPNRAGWHRNAWRYRLCRNLQFGQRWKRSRARSRR